MGGSPAAFHRDCPAQEDRYSSWLCANCSDHGVQVATAEIGKVAELLTLISAADETRHGVRRCIARS
jgi:hypothetical protein